MKIRPIENPKGELVGYSFYCPGCGHDHVYYVIGKIKWEFNGDMDRPSFTPSLLNRWGNRVPGYEHTDHGGGQCHLYVTDGKINYCGDCTHEMNGKQNVELKEE